MSEVLRDSIEFRSAEANLKGCLGRLCWKNDRDDAVARLKIGLQMIDQS